jgi:CRP-like cAMP-binding protein
MNSPADGLEAGAGCEFQENLEILRQIPFFAGLPLESLKVFAYLCTRETYAAGETLFSPNDDDGRSYYLISGTARLVYPDAAGEVVVRTFGPGQFLGGLSLLGGLRHLYGLQAETDTVCLVLTRERFLKALEQFPGLVPRILKAAVDMVRGWEKRHLFDMQDKRELPRGMAGMTVL